MHRMKLYKVLSCVISLCYELRHKLLLCIFLEATEVAELVNADKILHIT